MITLGGNLDKMKNTVLKKDQEKVSGYLDILIGLAIDSYECIEKSTLHGKKEDLLDVYSNSKKVKEEINKINKRLLESFTHSPFGKDLRRDISYIHIAKSLGKIQDSAYSVSEFLKVGYDNEIKKQWIAELAGKIIRRLKDILILIENEELELIDKVWDANESINSFYKENLEKIKKNLILAKENSSDDFNQELIIGYVLALKNFEIAGDEIKEIVEMINFIVTGKYLS